MDMSYGEIKLLCVYSLANPEYNGGATVTEFAAQMISPDNTSRECYKGRDLDCIVAGLLPGRPYLFQVRAFNRAGVSINRFLRQRSRLEINFFLIVHLSKV